MTSVRRKLLSVHHLSMDFPQQHSVLNVLNDISFDVYQGETLGLVGESGCGKTTLGRCLMRMYQPTRGSVLYQPDDHSEAVDLCKVNGAALRQTHRQIRMVFQDPWSSLNPRMTVFDIIAEPLKNQRPRMARSEMEDRVASMMLRVGLRPELMSRYPYAFSGGQRQRVGIARALVVEPRLVVADEAVSALDVSIRAQILNLLADLKEELNLTYIFISHDLGVVRHICDRVAVMYAGELVELADTNQLYGSPGHPYTEALISAVPRPDPRLRSAGSQRKILRGEVPDVAHRPTGCVFHPRCLYASEACRTDAPELGADHEQHLARCLRRDELTLTGV
ncbi:ABC transporter ATP-binding protein [Gynuella sunshinyii]|uniref:ABC-type oligopeptide transport system, ATPase component n=1 Tax=Gynuella sunshinyii YC6258 TaxID=1445510 RepID=A0A0C5W5T8_9GAMM|nr:oligopeptide/dipeptide ABC transporter ATP-binding protein [Gynuella sunshinyii]AJQ97969.1 ABC-type oligopeptide transport system, ATPase component [Gynuella sunshinyii YC6258]